MVEGKIIEVNVKTGERKERIVEIVKPYEPPFDPDKNAVDLKKLKKLIDYAEKQKWI